MPTRPKHQPSPRRLWPGEAWTDHERGQHAPPPPVTPADSPPTPPARNLSAYARHLLREREQAEQQAMELRRVSGEGREQKMARLRIVQRHADRYAFNAARAWCRQHGVQIVDGHVTLYKVVGDDYRSPIGGGLYIPGSMPAPGEGRQAHGMMYFAPLSALSAWRAMVGARFHRTIGAQIAVDDLSPCWDSRSAEARVRRVAGLLWEVNEGGTPLAGG